MVHSSEGKDDQTSSRWCLRMGKKKVVMEDLERQGDREENVVAHRIVVSR